MKLLIDLIYQLHLLGKKDLNISITGEHELLIFRKTEFGDIRNIIIDKEGDIEFVEIADIRDKSWNKHFFQPTEETIKEIAKLL